MFKNKDEIGVDLLSVDIQRERDHGKIVSKIP